MDMLEREIFLLCKDFVRVAEGLYRGNAMWIC